MLYGLSRVKVRSGEFFYIIFIMSTRDPDARYENLTQVVEYWWSEKIKTLHTDIPGIVRAYDPLTKRARIQPALHLLLTDGSEVEKPPILDVPLRQTATGGHMVHQQVDEGDIVLLIFSERGLEKFKEVWTLAAPGLGAVMAERDAMAIPWGIETIAPVVETGWVAQSADGITFFSLQGADQTITAQVEAQTNVLLEGQSQTITITCGDNQVIITPGKVVIEVSTGEKVHIGGESGQPLATDTFVGTQYNTHIHSTPMGPSGPPLVAAPRVPGADITAKGESE